jgi:hypothetical protein
MIVIAAGKTLKSPSEAWTLYRHGTTPLWDRPGGVLIVVDTYFWIHHTGAEPI